MSIADPNKTILTGENPFIRLSLKDGDPNSTDASYWRIIFSPAGPGWPAPGSADTELGVLMEPKVCHGETEVYTGVQA